MSTEGLIKHTGACHCGKVRFECYTEGDTVEVEDCNCSICFKKGFWHLIVPNSRFKMILEDPSDLSTYTFGTGTAKHYFCKTCGIAPFYVPRSNPDGWDVNARCIDEGTIQSIKVNSFDGRNSWATAAAKLSHLSKE